MLFDCGTKTSLGEAKLCVKTGCKNVRFNQQGKDQKPWNVHTIPEIEIKRLIKLPSDVFKVEYIVADFQTISLSWI